MLKGLRTAIYHVGDLERAKGWYGEVPFCHASRVPVDAFREPVGGQMRIETIDLNFLGAEEIIASFLLLGDSSAALVETSPTTCLDHRDRAPE